MENSWRNSWKTMHHWYLISVTYNQDICKLSLPIFFFSELRLTWQASFPKLYAHIIVSVTRLSLYIADFRHFSPSTIFTLVSSKYLDDVMAPWRVFPQPATVRATFLKSISVNWSINCTSIMQDETEITRLWLSQLSNQVSQGFQSKQL